MLSLREVVSTGASRPRSISQRAPRKQVRFSHLAFAQTSRPFAGKNPCASGRKRGEEKHHNGNDMPRLLLDWKATYLISEINIH